MDILFLPSFLLVLVRTTSFMLATPIFSHAAVPAMAKLGFSFFLAFLTTAVIGDQQIPLDNLYYLLILKEIVIGVLIGFIVRVLFEALKLAGLLVDMQMGLASATIFDPQSGIQVNLSGHMKTIFATLFLLSTDAHHLLIRGLMMSYELVPLQKLAINLGSDAFLNVLVVAFLKSMASAFLMASPIVISLVLVDVSLGIIAKAVPQMNIFVVGFPVKIIAGFVIMLVVFPAFFAVVSRLLREIVTDIGGLLKVLGA